MPNPYYDTIDALEQKNVSRDYITGWASGFLGNPKLEQQRVTEGWDAGYQDGRARNTEHADSWTD